MKNTQRGFALLVAVIFTSVMLSFGLALGSLAYKQQVLASSATQSQYAFYAADAGLECALYTDQVISPVTHASLFAFPPTDPGLVQNVMSCNGTPAAFPPTYPTGEVSYTPGVRWVIAERLRLFSNTRCADITVYKYATGVTYLFSQGYNVSCDTLAAGGERYVTRGIHAQY